MNLSKGLHKCADPLFLYIKSSLSINKKIFGNKIKISVNKQWVNSPNEQSMLDTLNEMLPYCTEVQYIKISVTPIKLTYNMTFYFNKEGSKFITIYFNNSNTVKIVGLYNNGNKSSMKYNTDIIKALLQENNF